MTMHGSNHLTLCIAELRVALQEYLDKRWPTNTPIVGDVELNNSAIEKSIRVSLVENSEKVEHHAKV